MEMRGTKRRLLAAHQVDLWQEQFNSLGDLFRFLDRDKCFKFINMIIPLHSAPSVKLVD